MSITTWLRPAGRLLVVGLMSVVSVGVYADEPAATEKPLNPKAVAPKSGEAAKTEPQLSNDDVQGFPPVAVPYAVVPKTRPVAQQELPEYWLGLVCVPASPALLAQLKLPATGAILIEQVHGKSPAEKAGFKEYDLLIMAADKPLLEPVHLLTLLQSCDGKELAFTVIRTGEKQTLTVKPEKRPEVAAANQLQILQGNPQVVWKNLHEQLDRSRVPIRIHFLHPGMILPARAPAMAFPDDLHVHLDKHGNKPATLQVEHGGKKWSITEDKLHELPADVKVHVEQLFSKVPNLNKVEEPSEVEGESLPSPTAPE